MSNKILIIDDEIGIREGCRRALASEGHIIDEAATLQEGRAKIEHDGYDLILLDVLMPDGHGIDLLEFIHQKDPQTIVIIITGFGTVELAVEAIKRGAFDFISKPFSVDILQMRVNQGLEKRRLSLETMRLQEIEKQAIEAERKRDELQRLNEFKSNFMLMVAHELRSPVNAIQSLLKTLLTGLAGELNANQKEILTRIESRLEMLLELINDLLTLASAKSEIATEPLKKIPLIPVLQRLEERFKPQAEQQGVTLLVEIPAQPVQVLATEEGLERMLSNLMSNAIKYTHTHGQVVVSTEIQEEQVGITVSDTGIGIPPEAIPNLGTEFFRAENVRRSRIIGTGLGLSIVKNYVQQFEGELIIQSELGKGSKFTVKLIKAERTSP